MDQHSVYIAQPMGGRSDVDILEERVSILKFMEELLGSEIVEVPSFFRGEERNKMKPLRMLGMGLELMSDADVIVFAPKWEEARGCRIEHECALEYGYRIIDLSDGQIEREL